jgi:hypothetical protein
MATTGQFMMPNTLESGMYCPMCRDMRGAKDVKLQRDGMARHQFKCTFGHAIDYNSLQTMRPDMVPFIAKEIPDPSRDDKAELYIRKEIWQKFSTMYAGRINATMTSVMATMLDGDFLFLTGDTVRKLNKQGVRKQEDILAMVDDNARLVAENEQVTRDSQRLASLFANAAKGLQNGAAEE